MTDLAAQLDEAHERIRQLETLLGMATPLPGCIGLTRHQARMLGAILARPIASYDTLAIAMEASDRSASDSVVVQACKLRRKLAPFGVEIKTRHGEGYWMTPEDKARLRALASSI